MKLVAIVRTLNEEEMLPRFLQAYAWADRILIADGGSTDRTLEIAHAADPSQVGVRSFAKTHQINDGVVFNPEGAHIQFLIDWAVEEEADWVFFDDCDSLPTLSLQENIRSLLNNWVPNALFARRIYFWYDGCYFPNLDVGASMWGWRPKDLSIRGDTSVVNHAAVLGVPWEHQHTWCLPDPYRLLHHSWRSEEQVQAKLRYYAQRGITIEHPLKSCGPLAAAPDWAKD